MSRWMIALCVTALGFVATSCTENAPPQQNASRQEQLPQKPVALPAQPQNTSPASAQQQAKPVNTGMPIPPKDARYTICCQSITGPTHVQEANLLKEKLSRQTQLHDWYVIHSEQESTLYYGFYRSFNDPKDPAETGRAQNDSKAIHAISDAQGDQPFRLAVFVELASPDPDAPPEWNLANIKNGPDDDAHYWSLQIAAYKDSPQRKQFAVDAVRAARAEGIPAYYYHGETISSVLVGCWPRKAVKEQDAAAGQTDDPNQPIMVLPFTLPANTPTDVRDSDGQRVKVMAPKIEPQDPTMLQMMQRYPDHYVNGAKMVRRIKNPQTGQEKDIADKSFLVQIPAREGPMPTGATGVANGGASATPPVAPVLSRPDAPPSGSGKLKSIGD